MSEGEVGGGLGLDWEDKEGRLWILTAASWWTLQRDLWVPRARRRWPHIFPRGYCVEYSDHQVGPFGSESTICSIDRRLI